MSEELIRFELKNRSSAGCLGRCKERIYSGPYFFDGFGIKDGFFQKNRYSKEFFQARGGDGLSVQNGSSVPANRRQRDTGQALGGLTSPAIGTAFSGH